ncbi:MAG: 16S rRNA (adenine(1518)-N(6)/adenine(1519)-N(6))-dimethyltransferase RsmA, partial [Deltaproteobacteria bacterium]|nr:16S rRNA (adenine(1518)-N(6)/adenine(1519)-N(6))-dimethyltransferase RsmA [Deltaproteobacteria bacterium]
MSPAPKAILAKLGLAPLRSRGQNFISDRGLAGRLAAYIYAKADGPIVEIGPGLGALTGPLLAQGATVTAVEIDKGLATELKNWPQNQTGELKVLEMDALNLDLRRDLGPGPFMICGNLPYNISTQLLFWYLSQAEVAPKAVFMLQKEMAERLTAKPGSRDYGRLTVAVGLWHEVKTVFDVPSLAFSPRPKVKSSVVLLTPKSIVPNISREAVGRLTMAAFHARRKTLFNNLTRAYGRENTTRALESLSLEPSIRSEMLEPET